MVKINKYSIKDYSCTLNRQICTMLQLSMHAIFKDELFSLSFSDKYG